MLKKIKVFFHIFLCIILICPCAYSQGKVTELSEGDLAPFSGTLMTNDVATKLYLDSKFSKEECNIKIKEKIDTASIACNKNIKILESKLSIELEKFEKLIEIKNDRIKFLEKNWHPDPWYEKNSFWFSTGVIAGVIITIAAGYAIGQASR